MATRKTGIDDSVSYFFLVRFRNRYGACGHISCAKMSVFEVISKEDYESATGRRESAVADEGEASGLWTPTSKVNDPNLPLTWCEFCKGHYNEYHFGDIDERNF